MSGTSHALAYSSTAWAHARSATGTSRASYAVYKQNGPMPSALRACAMQAEGRGDRRRVGLQRHWRALAQPRRRVRLHRRAHLHPQLLCPFRLAAAPACALQCCPGVTRPLVGHHPRLIFDTVRATTLLNLTLHEGRQAPRPSAQVRMLPAPRHTRSATSVASATARAAGAPLAVPEPGSQPSPLSSAAAGAAGSSVACKRRSTARTRGAALPRGRGAAGRRGPAAGRALCCRLRQSAVPARLACHAGKDTLAGASMNIALLELLPMHAVCRPSLL